MKLGVLVIFDKDIDIAAAFKNAMDMELPTCQLSIWDYTLYTDDNAGLIRDAAAETGMEISAVWAGLSGPAVWDFYEGHETLGLVPKAYRFARLKELFKAADFAEQLGVTDVITHVGFIPENPYHEDFRGVVTALRTLAAYMKTKGQYFLFETGQETPVTLLRTIEEIGTGNLGVNFDTMNLLAYGKANPVDAVSMLGPYIRNTHIKDGFYPTNGKTLGEQTAVGEGAVDFPKLLSKLRDFGYDRYLTIEREISGEQQIKDILSARDFLKALGTDSR